MSPVELARHTTPGAGTPVVLLHGLGDTAGTWSGFVSLLDRPTIAFDLRGHGASPRPGSYTVDEMAADVVAALGSFADEPIDLIGHSMGGRVASEVALRVAVRRLVLEEAPVPPRSGPPLPDPSPPERPAEPIDFDWAVVGPMRRALRATNPLWWREIERLTTPVLWLSGGPPSHLEPSRMAEAAAAMPTATMCVIPVGHLIHTDAPESFADAVLSFLA